MKIYIYLTNITREEILLIFTSFVIFTDMN